MKLLKPPYLQIALDLVSYDSFIEIINNIPFSEKILIEAGTPLIKKFGAKIIKEIKKPHNKCYVIADMKTLDVGWLEVQIGAEAGANAIAISGLAPIETITSSLQEAEKRDVDIVLDLMNVSEPLTLLKSLEEIPQIILFHRGIDQEGNKEHPWELITEVKKSYPEALIAIAGGLSLETSKKALNKGADIIVIGRAITQKKDISNEVTKFLEILDKRN